MAVPDPRQGIAMKHSMLRFLTTNTLDPEPWARNVFAFHQPATLATWLTAAPLAQAVLTGDGDPPPVAGVAPATFLARVRQMPELVTEWGDFKLWPAQVAGRPRPGNGRS
jgi:type I restriction enzyme, R subunit